MPPNKKGGKNYKKGKHVDDEPILYECLPGQMYGRVIKLVGGCNAIVYCNDNRERICHIRGNMRKKVWISTGDIVLISLRELNGSGTTPGGTGSGISSVERGDICAKYDQQVVYKLREKDHKINEKLFTLIEKMDNAGKKLGVPAIEDDDGFLFESDDRNGQNEDESSGTDEFLPANRAAQKKAMMLGNNDNDMDIDDI